MKSDNLLLLNIKSVLPENLEWIKSKYPDESDDVEYHDAGFDIYCPDKITIPPKSLSYKIPLGIKTSAYKLITWTAQPIKTPSSFELWPRSSCGSKTPLRLSNSIGLIDAGYRGELIAIVDNLSDKEYQINKGDRLFQIVAPDHRPIKPNILENDEDLDCTSRGEGGLGSTGK